MPTESPRPLARQLLRVVLGTPDVPDGDLLARFVASRDEEAFAEVVRRHGPMVFAVCRRITGRPHDAEDAFQAAFLVLARRAAHVTRPELLANWLYGVAYRTALEARAARRRAEEHVVPAAPEPAAPPPPDDVTELRRVIDEELAKLPDKYRTAVVLCDLEGLPRAAAAAQMGIPEGTLSSRLAYARKILAQRLSRRGVTTSATVISAALGRDSVATAVPHSLMNTTIFAAVRFAPGGTGPSGVSPAVSSLTDGVLKTMLATRLRQLLAIGLLMCGLIGVGSVLSQQLQVTLPQDPNEPPTIVLDPATGIAELQPKTQPKKVAAKGIEDDDVPYASFPAQAVVRIEEGKLLVRQRVRAIQPVTQTGGSGVAYTTYQQVSRVSAAAHDPADVAVFDMKGNRLSPKAWKELLKSDVHVLLASDGKLPNPRELTLFKQDTLLVVLPATATPAPAVEVPGYKPQTYYVPTAPSGYAPAPTPAPAAHPPGNSWTPTPSTVRPPQPNQYQPAPKGTTVPQTSALPSVSVGSSNSPLPSLTPPSADTPLGEAPAAPILPSQTSPPPDDLPPPAK